MENLRKFKAEAKKQHSYKKKECIWRLSLPGPQNGMSSAIFSEAMCMHLCLPPMYVDEQASCDRVGKYIGRSKVDLYGIIAAHSYQ